MNLLSEFCYYITPKKKYAKNKLNLGERIKSSFTSFFKKSRYREANNKLYFLNKNARITLTRVKRTGIKYSLVKFINKYKSLTPLKMYHLMFSDKGKTFDQVLFEYFLIIDTFRALKIEYEGKLFSCEEIAEELKLEQELKEYNKRRYNLKGAQNA